MFCPNCGYNCNDNDVVCGNCGAPLRANPTNAYVNPAPGGGPAEKVKNLGKNLTGNKTILYVAIGIVGLALLILLASLIFRNPAGTLALKYEKYLDQGEYLKANKMTVFALDDYADDYEKMMRRYNDEKFDFDDYYDDAKDDHIDWLEKYYGSDYKIKNYKVAYIYKWEQKDVDKWVKNHKDLTVFGDEDLDEYVDFSKIKKICTVYISCTIQGKKKGAASMDSVLVAQVGGKWKILECPTFYRVYDWRSIEVDD